MNSDRVVSLPSERSAFCGYRFPPEIILLAVRWYLRYGLSYRDVEELLAEHGIDVDHVTIYRWVQRFTPLLIDAARPLPARCRRAMVRRRKPTSRSPANGATSIALSISSARSSTCMCRHVVTSLLLAGSSAPALTGVLNSLCECRDVYGRT